LSKDDVPGFRFPTALASAIALSLAALLAPSRASAADVRAHVEGSVAHFLPGAGAWQPREIGLGFVGAGALELAPSPRFGLEARVFGGRFTQSDRPEDPAFRAVGETGLFGLGLGLRWMLAHDHRGPWFGTSLGGLRTGDRTRATFDARLGWDLRLGGDLRGGPFLGYLHVLQPDDGALRPQDGRIALAGFHLAFDPEAKPPPPLAALPPEPPEPPLTRCPDGQEPDPRFGDAHGCVDPLETRRLALPDRCPDEPEDFVGASDADGCPSKDAEVKVIGDEIVLNDRVYFDFGLARVKRRSWPLLRSLAKLILAHPEYVVVNIHGHTDEIGDDAYNQKLSEQRAGAVRKKLIEFGVPEARLASRGFGKTKPRVTGKDETSRQENRRVEFLIERKVGGTTP
jgi:outer membrane protein OmpA-like peptidoglycan-associated protein